MGLIRGTTLYAIDGDNVFTYTGGLSSVTASLARWSSAGLAAKVRRAEASYTPPVASSPDAPGGFVAPA